MAKGSARGTCRAHPPQNSGWPATAPSDWCVSGWRQSITPKQEPYLGSGDLEVHDCIAFNFEYVHKYPEQALTWLDAAFLNPAAIPVVLHKIFLRDASQQVTEKTVTGSRDVAKAAFSALVDRADLDGQKLLAVLSYKGSPVAHHDFRFRADGAPHSQYRFWRGRTSEIKWPSTLFRA